MLFVGAGCSHWRQINTHAATAPAPSPSPGASVFASASPATELVCEGDSCKDCWERAQVWVANHSRYGVQTATEALIQTYSPGESDPGYGFTITKEPLGSGRYRIVMDQYCASDCTPTADEVHRAFYHYLRTGHDLLLGAADLGSGIR